MTAATRPRSERRGAAFEYRPDAEAPPDRGCWAAAPPHGAPQLVLISSETAEANAAQDLAAPILLDQQFQVGRAFGATGTPSAVLLDAEGYIASDVAVGVRMRSSRWRTLVARGVTAITPRGGSRPPEDGPAACIAVMPAVA